MGWTYNVVDPNVTTNPPTLAGVGISFTIVSLSVVCLRLYVRKCIVRSISIDDWIIVITWLLSFIFTTITLAQTRWGLGLPNVNDIPSQNTYDFGLLQYVGAPFYISAIAGFKLSIIFAFLRIAVDRAYRIGIICVATTCSLFYFSYFIAQLNLCNPIAKQWDATIATGSCIPAVPFYTAMGSITFVFDILTMLTPIPILLHSCFSFRKNILIGLLFIFGIFLSIVQILRITSLRAQASPLDTSTLLTWSLVEVNLGIILASLIPLSPLPILQSFFDRGSPQSIAQSLASYDTRKTMDKVKGGFRKRFGRDGELRNRLLLFLGYGELRPDLERETRSGSRLRGQASSEELNGFPMGILKTTEVIVSREGSSWGELKDDEL